MARTPLFESTWAQRSAVSVSVGLVLLLVMGLAWVTTTNQWVQLPGANVGVPVMWEQIGTAGENISGKVFHINQQQPIRLVLAGSRFPQQVDPDTATRVLSQRMGGLMPTDVGSGVKTSTVRGRSVSGKRYFIDVRSGDRARLHWLVTLTADQQTYWLIYLTDATLNPRHPRTGQVGSAQYQQTKQRGAGLIEDIANTLTLTNGG